MGPRQPQSRPLPPSKPASEAWPGCSWAPPGPPAGKAHATRPGEWTPTAQTKELDAGPFLARLDSAVRADHQHKCSCDPGGWRPPGLLDSQGNGALRRDQPALGGTCFPRQTAPSDEAYASRHVITQRDAHTIACGVDRSRHNRLCYSKTGNTKTQQRAADARSTHRRHRSAGRSPTGTWYTITQCCTTRQTHPHLHTGTPLHSRKAADTSTDAPDLTSRIIVPENRNTCSPPSCPPAVAGVD